MLLKQSMQLLFILSKLYINTPPVASDVPSAESCLTVIRFQIIYHSVSPPMVCNTLAPEMGITVSERDVLNVPPTTGCAFWNITEKKSEQYLPLSINEDCVEEGCQIMLPDHLIATAIQFLLFVQETLMEVLVDFFARLVLYTSHFALAFTPHRGWWPQYIHRLVLCTTYGCFTKYQSVSEICLEAKMTLMRHLFRRCDFYAYLKHLCRVLRRTVIFIIIALLPPLLTWIHNSSIPSTDLNVPDYKVLHSV